jgi:type IV pilus assembly protein PilW
MNTRLRFIASSRRATTIELSLNGVQGKPCADPPTLARLALHSQAPHAKVVGRGTLDITAASRRARCGGMTLVEILIALVLGVLMAAGMQQVYISNKQSYRLAEQQSRLQENARYALEVLSKGIRLGGYEGCPSITSENPTNTSVNPDATIASATMIALNQTTNQGIGGNEGGTSSWTPALAASLPNAPNPLAGTDVVTVLYGESCGGYLTANMATTTAAITIGANTCGISDAANTLLISDCSSADIFDATPPISVTAAGGSVTPTAALSQAYGTDAELYAYRAYSYFIGTGASGLPSLFRLDNTQNTSVEIVEGIQDLQVWYGIDTDKAACAAAAADDYTANQYLNASLVANWCQLVSVRICILVSTTETAGEQLLTNADRQTYTDCNGTTIAAANNDNRLRRTFTTTIAVRNRMN